MGALFNLDVCLVLMPDLEVGNFNIYLVWKLKDKQPHPIPYELTWEILANEKPYNQVTGVCRLCLLEAHYLMFDKLNTTLNSSLEYFNICPHKRNYLLVKDK